MATIEQSINDMVKRVNERADKFHKAIAKDLEDKFKKKEE